MDTIKTKRCRCCNYRLPLSFFYRRSASKDGYSLYCKVCTNEKMMLYRAKLRAVKKDEKPEPSADGYKKLCRRCGRLLPLDQFTQCNSSKDGKSVYCQDCCRDLRKIYREKKKRECFKDNDNKIIRPMDVELELESLDEQARVMARDYAKKVWELKYEGIEELVEAAFMKGVEARSHQINGLLNRVLTQAYAQVYDSNDV